MASEGAEEYLQEILTPIFKNIALGTNEEINLITEDAIYSFILGALSSGWMKISGLDGGKNIVSTLIDMSAKNPKNIAAAELYGDRVPELIDKGLASPVGSQSNELAKIAQRKTSKGKDLTGYEIRSLANANQAQIISENYNDALPKAEKRLSELGEKDTKKIAKLVAKKASGQELTRKEIGTLARSQYGSKVAKELSAEYQTTYSKIATKSDADKSITDHAGEESRITEQSTEDFFDVSSDGKTVYNGEEVSIQGISGYKNGKLMLKLSNGQVADASQVSYGSESESVIYNTVANMDISSSKANIIINRYLGQKNDTSAEQYALGIEEAYRYGQEGISREKLADSSYASKLNPGEQDFMYRQGQKASGKQTARDQSRVDSAYQQAKKALGQKDTEKATGKKYSVRLSEGPSRETMDESQAASYDLVEQIAPAVKGDILIYEGKKEWGYYDADTDTICLNIYARWSQKSMMAFTLSHELVHRAKAGSPAKFKAFANFLMKEYGKHGADVDAMVAEQLSAATESEIEMTPEEAYIEVICDACQRMLLDTDAGKKLAEFGAQSKQNKNFVHEFVKWLRERLDKLRNIFRNVEPDSLAAKEFQKFDAAAKQILADMFVDMSMDAGEKLSTIHEAGMGKKLTASEGSTSNKNPIDNNQITYQDIEALRKIGRKSINQFTSKELQTAEKWARKFWKEFGTKSPFFRSWFGDWRAGSTKPAYIVAFAYGETGKINTKKRYVTNQDLEGRRILVDDTVNEDSIHYAKEHGDEKQIRKLLGKVDEILGKGILLDTRISERSSGNKKAQPNLCIICIRLYPSMVHHLLPNSLWKNSI